VINLSLLGTKSDRLKLQWLKSLMS